MVSHQISSYCIILYFHIYLSWRAGSPHVALYMYSKYFDFDFRIRNTFVLFYSICVAWAPAACTLQYTYIIIYRYYRDILADKIKTTCTLQYTYFIIYRYYRDILAPTQQTQSCVCVCVCASVQSCLLYIYIYIYIYMLTYAEVCWLRCHCLRMASHLMLMYADYADVHFLSLAFQHKCSGRSWAHEPVLNRDRNVHDTTAPAVYSLWFGRSPADFRLSQLRFAKSRLRFA